MAATAAPPESDGTAESPVPPPRRRSRLIVAAAGVLVLAGLGAGAWLFAPRLLGAAKPAAAVARPQPKVHATVPLGAVVVNLAGEGRRYVKVSLELGLESAKAVHEVEVRKPQVLDLVITVLSGKAAEELADAERRQALKAELLAGIRGEVGLETVIRVFFTEFLIQ